MVRHSRWSVLAFGIWGSTVMAQEWELGRWHQVAETSPFHTEDGTFSYSAGILQENGRFALMVLGDPDEGALVSVNMPMSEIATKITSTLVMPSGAILVREAQGSQLVAERTPDGESVTYSFGIAPGDIEQFMAALSWRVKADGVQTTISLAGSRDAISAAIEAREAISVEEVTSH